MSQILVIPDTHLKPKMFDLADKIMRENSIDYAVQLGDNLDDFYCYDNQYYNHNARMLKFKNDHKNTIWLWGNHEISYILNRPVTGNIYSGKQYAYSYRENFNPKFAHLDEKIIFSHAGIFQEFLDETHLTNYKIAEALIKKINRLDYTAFWRDNSPIWARHEYDRLAKPRLFNGLTQVVGHTPIKKIQNIDNENTTDLISTNWGVKISTERMIIVDTSKPSYEIINIDYRKQFGEER